MTYLSKLGLEPSFIHVVIRYGSTVLEVLLFVILQFCGEVVVQNVFVVFSSRSREKENIFTFGRSGDRSVKPLTVYEEKPPIENRNFAVN